MLSEGSISALTSEEFCNLGAGWAYVNFFQRCLSMNCVFFPQKRTIVTTCRLNDTPEGLCAWKTLRSGCMIFIPMFILIQTQRPIWRKKKKAEKKSSECTWNLFLEYLYPMNDLHMHVLLSSWGTAQQQGLGQTRDSAELPFKECSGTKTKPKKPQTKTHSHLYRGFILYFF